MTSSLDTFNFDEWEIVSHPVPEHEIPREMILRITGYDFDVLEPITWEMVRTDPAIEHHLTQLIARLGKTQMYLRKKT